MKRKFIVNPSAGNGRAYKTLFALERHFVDREIAFDVVAPKNRDDTIQIAKQATDQAYDQIIVLGGDGTLNAVANGVLASPNAAKVTLVAAPWGSGCDYARAILKGTAWQDVVEHCAVESHDVGVIESFGARRDKFYFLNAATVGISAAVVQRQRKAPKALPSLLSYALPAAYTLLKDRPQQMRLTVDGEVYDGKFLNLFCVKGKTIGGGMKLGGAVTFDDGKFDVTLVSPLSIWESAVHFRRIFSGKFSHPKFVKRTARTVEIKTGAPLHVEFDGEVLAWTDARISLLPRALNFCVPLAKA